MEACISQADQLDIAARGRGRSRLRRENAKYLPSPSPKSPNGKLRLHVREFSDAARVCIVDEAVAVEGCCCGIVVIVAHDGTHGNARHVARVDTQAVGEGVWGDGFTAEGYCKGWVLVYDTEAIVADRSKSCLSRWEGGSSAWGRG